MGNIIWLDEPECQNSLYTGGKAANLARLCATHPVPFGFCITAHAHQTWATAEVLESDDVPPPEDFIRLVTEAYAELGRRSGTENPTVAVRSSAVDEDGEGASFAGIYISCLNVRGAKDVVHAVKRCWRSAADPRVKAYREKQGLSAANVGVLVQELVAADTAAVVFSANPTTGATDEIMINANYGLGESIVSGIATPDTWVLKRPDLSTLRFHLGHKERMTVLSQNGTHEIPVLRSLRGRASLTDTHVAELAQLALRLEQAMGWPVDIECAYRGNALFLLQCRPITTGKAQG